MNEELTSQFSKLEETLSALLTRLEPYNEEQLNKSPTEGAWSVLQVMHHVMIAEKGSLAYMKKKLQYIEQKRPEKAGMSAKLRSWALNNFLRSSIKAKAPTQVAEIPEQLNKENLFNEWLIVREELGIFLDGLPEDVLPLAFYRHPLAGRMNIYQGLEFFQCHLDRHQKQIEGVLAKVNS